MECSAKSELYQGNPASSEHPAPFPRPPPPPPTPLSLTTSKEMELWKISVRAATPLATGRSPNHNWCSSWNQKRDQFKTHHMNSKEILAIQHRQEVGPGGVLATFSIVKENANTLVIFLRKNNHWSECILSKNMTIMHRFSAFRSPFPQSVCFFISIPKKDNDQEYSTTTQLHSFHTLAK